MAAKQKNMLVAANSKLGKVNLPTVLRKEGAWESLPVETRQALFDLLPQPRAGQAQHNIDVNPLNTPYHVYIERELRLYQDDLKDGKEGKKWRTDAIAAGRELRAGKFDEWLAVEKKEYWGDANDEDHIDKGQNEEGGEDGLEVKGPNHEGERQSSLENEPVKNGDRDHSHDGVPGSKAQLDGAERLTSDEGKEQTAKNGTSNSIGSIKDTASQHKAQEDAVEHADGKVATK